MVFGLWPLHFEILGSKFKAISSKYKVKVQRPKTISFTIYCLPHLNNRSFKSGKDCSCNDVVADIEFRDLRNRSNRPHIAVSQAVSSCHTQAILGGQGCSLS